MAEHAGLYLIHEPEDSEGDAYNNPIDIVAVHSLGGHPYKSWGSEKSGTLWLRDFLPKSLPSCRILTYGYLYPVPSWIATSSITTIAENLLRDLVEHRHHNSNTNSSIIFIAHSLGGIIVQQALLHAFNSPNISHRNILKATYGLIFLGTPHNLSTNNIARVLQYVASTGIGEEKLHSQLTSSFSKLALHLGAIGKTFQDLLLSHLFKFNIVSFFEELPVDNFGLVIAIVVDRCSALSHLFTVLPLYADHETICKFNSFEEPNYKRLLGELSKIIQISTEEKGVFNHNQQEVLRRLQVGNGADSIKSASADSCNWLFVTQEYKSWLSDDRTCLFWIKGKPGSGKSTLMKYITQESIQHTFDTPLVATAAFFFHRGDIRGSSIKSLFQSLLYQFLSQIPAVISDFIPLLSQKRFSEYLLAGFDTESKSWMYHNLRDIFRESLSLFSRTHRLRIFIDGLDECSEKDSPSIMSIFSSIDPKSPGESIKICISSRNIPYLTQFQYLKHRTIVLENENVVGIQKFVELSMTRLPRLTTRKIIEEELVRKASGSFLWVRIVLEHLHLEKANEISKSSVLKFPDTLGELYRMILDRNTHKEGSSAFLAEKILKWICFAKRPLSVKELAAALSVDDPTPIIPDGWGATSRQIIDQSLIITLCGSFVEVQQDVVQVIHQSVKDFWLSRTLLSDSVKGGLTTEHFGNIHLQLARTCLLYLSYDTEWSRIKSKPVDYEMPLLDYAAEYWLEHTKSADRPGLSHVALLKILRWPSNKVLGHWAHLNQKKAPIGKFSDRWGQTALHISAAFGLENLIQAIFEAEQCKFVNWDIFDAYGRTPLSLAAEMGEMSIVRLLLQAGANVNIRDLCHGLSPLQWAILNGQAKVVALLLQTDTIPNAQLSGSKEILIAAARGHTKVLEMLLDRGVNPDAIDGHYGYGPLHLAAWHGNEDVVLQLLKRGSDPNLLDQIRRKTPLYYATAGCHSEVVQVLLNNGAGMGDLTFEAGPNFSISWPDRVGHSFPNIMTKTPSYYSPGSGTDTKSDGTSTSGSCQDAGLKNADSKEASKKRVREDKGSASSSERGGSGSDPNKQPNLNRSPISSTIGPGLKLACPYWKYDPGRYGSHRSCRPPTVWSSVHRLKEHLYQKHFIDICMRCCSIFKDPGALEAHYKATLPCSAKHDRDFADGFDDKQRCQLKARTSKKNYGNELQYWKGVYQILFPEVEISNIPSPCYKEDKINKASYDASCARARLTDPYLRQQIFQLIHSPSLADPVEPILELINRQQSRSIVTETIDQDEPPLGIDYLPRTRNDQSIDYPSTYLHEYHGSSFGQMSPSPWSLQPPFSHMDSGIYTASSNLTDEHSIAIADYSTEFSHEPNQPNSILVPRESYELQPVDSFLIAESQNFGLSIPNSGDVSSTNIDLDAILSLDSSDEQRTNDNNHKENEYYEN